MVWKLVDCSMLLNFCSLSAEFPLIFCSISARFSLDCHLTARFPLDCSSSARFPFNSAQILLKSGDARGLPDVPTPSTILFGRFCFAESSWHMSLQNGSCAFEVGPPPVKAWLLGQPCPCSVMTKRSVPKVVTHLVHTFGRSAISTHREAQPVSHHGTLSSTTSCAVPKTYLAQSSEKIRQNTAFCCPMMLAETKSVFLFLISPRVQRLEPIKSMNGVVWIQSCQTVLSDWYFRPYLCQKCTPPPESLSTKMCHSLSSFSLHSTCPFFRYFNIGALFLPLFGTPLRHIETCKEQRYGWTKCVEVAYERFPCKDDKTYRVRTPNKGGVRNKGTSSQ